MAKEKTEASVEEAKKEAVKAPKVSETAEVGAEGTQDTPAKEEKVSAKSAKYEAIDALFEELEPRILSGDTDRMNEQKAELLSVKIKIKRLI
jgi:hypothetical protein